MRTDVLGVGFDNLTLEEAVATGAALVDAGGFHYAVTPNPEFILAARKDPRFQQVLQQAHLVLPDGVGVIHSAKILGRPLKGRVPGIEFAQGLMAWMAGSGKRELLGKRISPQLEQIMEDRKIYQHSGDDRRVFVTESVINGATIFELPPRLQDEHAITLLQRTRERQEESCFLTK